MKTEQEIMIRIQIMEELTEENQTMTVKAKLESSIKTLRWTLKDSAERCDHDINLLSRLCIKCGRKGVKRPVKAPK